MAEVLHKVAGFEKREQKEYHPRPSSAGPERCIRQLVYAARGTQGKAIGDRFVMVLDDSSWHEELTADWIQKTAYRLERRQAPITIPGVFPWEGDRKRRCETCKTDVSCADLHGHIDGVLVDLAGQRYLWEHKALNHFTFNGVWNGEWPLDYFTQTTMYMRGLGLDKGVLLVKNKNTAQYIEFLLSFDKAADMLTVEEVIHSNSERRKGQVFANLYRDAVQKFEAVEHFRVSGKLPERQYELGHWRCEYCPYGETCWSTYEAELGAMQKGVSLPPGLARTVERYDLVSQEERNLGEEKKALAGEIKGAMKLLKIVSAVVGGLVPKITVQHRSQINREKIPAEILAAATEDKMIEVFRVDRVKAKAERKKAA